MKNFYRAMFKENASPSAALRQAQLKMRENPKWSSPFFWSAFTIEGEYK
jgi:CHAT domain-containing protein